MIAERLIPCPHCQGTDFKILPRNFIDGGGYVLTCQNGDCIARIWGHDEADVVARWNRRHTPPTTQLVLKLIRDGLEVAGIAEIHIDEETARLLLAEWENQ